jgi:DNA-binding response OmpR family regulator
LPKVMIVDDDLTTVKLVQMLLEMDGFEVSVSARGGDVIPLAVKVQPDLFLMDYHLADMDGVTILRDMRAGAAGGAFVNTPVVVTSGLDVEDEVMEAGADAFLVKPFEPSDLGPLFNRLIDQAK